jgi:hypothetical protein
MTTRQALHDLVDDLPDDLLGEAEETLARLKAHAVDPLLEALRNAPVDNEPLSAEEEEALHRWRAGKRRGRSFTQDEVERLLSGEGA